MGEARGRTTWRTRSRSADRVLPLPLFPSLRRSALPEPCLLLPPAHDQVSTRIIPSDRCPLVPDAPFAPTTRRPSPDANFRSALLRVHTTSSSSTASTTPRSVLRLPTLSYPTQPTLPAVGKIMPSIHPPPPCPLPHRAPRTPTSAAPSAHRSMLHHKAPTRARAFPSTPMFACEPAHHIRLLPTLFKLAPLVIPFLHLGSPGRKP